MADEVKILEIEFDNAIKQIQQLTAEVDKLKKEQSELAESAGTTSKEYIEVTAQLKVTTAELRSNEKVVQNVVKAQNANKGSIDQQRAALSLLTKQYNSLSKEQRETTGEGQALQSRIKGISDELKGLEGAIGDNRRNVGGYRGDIEAAAGSIDALRERAKALREEAAKLDINTKEFKDATDAAANLELQIDQALGKVNEFGQREPRNPAKKAFDDAVTSAVTLGATVKLLSDSFVENEDTQAALAKAVQGFALAQTVANLVKQKGAIIDTATLITTKAQTLATVAAAKVTGVLTGATRLFGITATQAWAAATLGLSVLITAIVALIANFDRVTNAVKSFFGIATNEGAKVVDIYKAQSEEIERQIRLTRQVSDLVEKNFARQIKLAEAAGQDTTKIRERQFKASEKFLKQEIELIKQRIDAELAAAKVTLSEKEFIALFEKRKQLEERLKDITIDFQAEAIKKERELREQGEKAAQQRFEERKKAEIDRITQAEKQIQEEERLLQQQRDNERKLEQERLQAIERQNNAIIAANEKQIQAEQRKREALAFIQQGITDDAQAALLALDQSTLERFALLTQEFQLSQQALFDQYQALLEENEDLTFDIFIEQQQRILESERQFAFERLAISQQFASAAGDILADAISDSSKGIEDFGRNITVLILDLLQRQILAAIAGATATEISTKGIPAGIASSAIATGLIQAAFGVAKSALSRPPKGFATGVVDLNGPGTETSDSIPAWLSKGESVVTAKGTDFLQSAFPGLLEFANSKHRFATGVVDFNPAPNVGDNFSVLEALRLLPPPIVRVTDIDKGFNDAREVQVLGTL